MKITTTKELQRVQQQLLSSSTFFTPACFCFWQINLAGTAGVKSSLVVVSKQKNVAYRSSHVLLTCDTVSIDGPVVPALQLSTRSTNLFINFPFPSTYPIPGRGEAGVYPRVHPGQVLSLSQVLLQALQNHELSYEARL